MYIVYLDLPNGATYQVCMLQPLAIINIQDAFWWLSHAVNDSMPTCTTIYLTAVVIITKKGARRCCHADSEHFPDVQNYCLLHAHTHTR